MRVGDAVRVRPGAESAEWLGDMADLTATVGDMWTDSRGERVNVVYTGLGGGVGCYVSGLPASDFEADVPLAAAPF